MRIKPFHILSAIVPSFYPSLHLRLAAKCSLLNSEFFFCTCLVYTRFFCNNHILWPREFRCSWQVSVEIYF